MPTGVQAAARARNHPVAHTAVQTRRAADLAAARAVVRPAVQRLKRAVRNRLCNV
ncbi:hypothetical protein [Paenibacillus rhizoplanae]|uniref:hypothetical protein n=1 Tax=Paenibacillus rhizoplanae TaxID=1917181 RepID=UPI00360A057A